MPGVKNVTTCCFHSKKRVLIAGELGLQLCPLVAVLFFLHLALYSLSVGETIIY